MPECHILPEDVNTIRGGGLVIFPTETLYGLGCVATDEDALRRLFAAKGRPAGQPPPVLVADREQMMWLVTQVPPMAAELMAAHWPGSLTIVLPARADVSPLLTAEAGGVRTVGVRQTGHPIALALCRAVGAPIVATSANISGATGAAATPHRLDEVAAELRTRVDVVLDGGAVGGKPSTVVDCSGGELRVIRQGAIAIAECGVRSAE